MLELLAIITMLCQVKAGLHDLDQVDSWQLQCQQWYLECMPSKTLDAHHALAQCVAKRQVKVGKNRRGEST